MSISLEEFRATAWEYYHLSGRHDLPWRQLEPDGSIDPYKVLVSEVMLQQTQVPRVIPKFVGFIRQFPSFAALASAPLASVLIAWNGLGYNRRAKFLWQAAGMVMHGYGGQLPDNTAELVKLPGVGKNTAGALRAYVFSQPVVFVETNIRTVYIHHFFAGQEQVNDTDIADVVAKTLPDNPREWYWALMDYGTHLKQTVGNLNTLSKHYTKQSAFHGSRRQIRGQVLRLLGSGPEDLAALQTAIGDGRLLGVLAELQKEGLIISSKGHYKLADA